MDLKETYNSMARDWADFRVNQDWWVGSVDHLVSLVPNDARILDAGCGDGIVVRYLCQRGFTAEGFDFSDKLLEIARERTPEANFFLADLYNLDVLADDAYDAIILQAVLLHIPKKDCLTILKGLVAKLKPGGHILVAVKEVKPDRPAELVEKDNYFGYEIERFFSYFTMPELKKYLEDAGLGVVYEAIAPMGQKTRWLQLIGEEGSS